MKLHKKIKKIIVTVLRCFLLLDSKIYEYIGILGFAVTANLLVTVVYLEHTVVPMYFTVVIFFVSLVSSVIFLNFSERLKKSSEDYYIDAKIGKTNKPSKNIEKSKWIYNQVEKKGWLYFSIIIIISSTILGVIQLKNINSSKPMKIVENAIPNYRNGWAQRYDAISEESNLYEKEYNLLSQIIKDYNFFDSIYILDAASGTGDLVKLLIDIPICDNCFVKGSDGSDEMIYYSKKKHSFDKNIILKSLWQDLTNNVFNITKRKFDIISILGNSIGQLTDTVEIKKVFKEVYKGLNDKGMFVVDYDLSVMDNIGNKRKFLTTTIYNNEDCPIYHRYIRKNDIIFDHLEIIDVDNILDQKEIPYIIFALYEKYINRWLREAGFKLINFNFVDYPYSIALCKK